MEVSTWMFLLVAILTLVLVVKLKVCPPKSKPIPGPTGLKCLAAFIQGARKNNLHHLALDWAQTFGDLVQVHFLNQNVVYINDSKLVRQLFNDPSFKDITNDRPPTFISQYVVFGDKNVAFTSRTFHQQKRRRLFHSVLKFYGQNVLRFESIIKKSLMQLARQIEGQEKVELTKEMSRATLRIVDILLVGETDKYSEENIQALEDFDTCFNLLFIFDNEAVLQPFPFLRYMPGLSLKKNYDALIEARDRLTQLYFDDQKKTYDPSRERGMVDVLLTAQKKLQLEGKTTLLEDDVIKALLCESTIASYLTTYGTMNILFLLLIQNPDIQAKIFAEITEVIGGSPPGLCHRSSMPYTEASILEVLRYATSGPFLLPHYTRESLNVNGFHIPKGSVLIANAWYCHRREDKWTDPWTFCPERFLDACGNLLQADHPTRQNLIAFGIGSRACPGEAFARSRMFLILATLVQHFEFFVLEGEQLPSADPRAWPPGAVLGPGSFTCRARLRQKVDSQTSS